MLKDLVEALMHNINMGLKINLEKTKMMFNLTASKKVICTEKKIYAKLYVPWTGNVII